MSSNISLNRVCKNCNNEFAAKTTVTKYCSLKCASKAYKLRVKNEKITKSNIETENIKTIPIERLKLKEFLTVKDAAMILNSSIRTIYNLIDRKSIRAVNLSNRKTLIKRSEIDKLFEEQNIPLIVTKADKGFMKIEYYNLIEIQKKYKISESGINGLIRKYNLPKAKNGLFTLLEKDKIDKLLG